MPRKNRNAGRWMDAPARRTPRDLDMSDVIADGERMRTEYLESLVAWDRSESDPCQRNTDGCCIDHDKGEHDCEVW